MDCNKVYTSEVSLLRDLKLGKEKAFREIFSRYHHRVYRYVLKISGNSNLSEEIAQDVFVKIWDYRANIDENRQFSFFIFKVAKNAMLNALKKEAVHNRLLEDDVINLVSGISPEDDYLWKQYCEILEQGLMNLPEKCRVIFEKSRFEGKSYEEIAADLGISKNTVRLQIIKSLKIMRDFFRQHPEMEIIKILLILHYC
ncbi:RNA polymerase sigma factor [Zunongwangia pacifica]|uniref:RNA polymerase sigma-70 factor n=1 Tax=Zunongwangia pacifica TaxID=2911062 RepID=A0A9X2CJC5_9FLAO|nr:RNA polymerase sigma-70 factor [Zunongwangia pacifica]MCL6217681.1 RNA polymerase sigma-70 factor [Zunongwangia pacifica]